MVRWPGEQFVYTGPIIKVGLPKPPREVVIFSLDRAIEDSNLAVHQSVDQSAYHLRNDLDPVIGSRT